MSSLQDLRNPPDNFGLRTLVYTYAFDPPGKQDQRMLAKLLVSSLLRTFFSGDIVVFRNSDSPLFLVGREGLKEFLIRTPFTEDLAKGHVNSQNINEALWQFHNYASSIIPANKYGKICYLEPGTLVLRNIDHLLISDGAILYQLEKGIFNREPEFCGYFTDKEMAEQSRYGINSGLFAINGIIFHEVVLECHQIALMPQRNSPREADCAYLENHSVWNRYIIDTRRKALRFESDEVQFPLHIQRDFKEYREAAILNFCRASAKDKIDLMYALYMMTFFHDSAGVFFNSLEM